MATVSYSWADVAGQVSIITHYSSGQSLPGYLPVTSGDGSGVDQMRWNPDGIPDALQVTLELVEGRNAFKQVMRGRNVTILDTELSNTLTCTG